MAYQAAVTVRMSWVPDGAGPMSVPTGASLMLGYPGTISLVTMPGSDTASAANLATLATNIGSAVATAFLLPGIQPTIAGWSTGGQ